MDYRENVIINTLISNGSVSLMELASTLDVGSQYLLQLISRMNLGFKFAGLPQAVISNDKRLMFTPEVPDARELLRGYVASCGYEEYSLTRPERRTILTLIILNSTCSITAEELASHLQVSRNTILGDINGVKLFLADSDIVFESKSGRGYSVIGPESSIRAKILEILTLNITHQHYASISLEVFQHLLIKELNADEAMLNAIRTIMKDEERHHGYKLSDYSFRITEYELMLIVDRLRKGFAIDTNCTASIEQSSKFAMSCDILRRIGELYHLDIPRCEVWSFVQSLRRKSYVKSSTKHVDELKISLLIEETIFDVMRDLGIAFYLESSLHNMLVDHMKSVIYRVRAGEGPIENPFLSEIKLRYGNVFTIVRRHVVPIEGMLARTLSDDEIAYVTMFFGATVERLHAEQAKFHKVKACIVCDRGRLVFSYIQSQLDSLRDLIDVVDKRAGHDDNQNDKDVQLVVSTIPYDMAGAKTVQISSPMMTPEDMAAVQSGIFEVLARNGEDKLDSPAMRRCLSFEGYPSWEHETSILPSNRIDLSGSATTMKGAIGRAGQLLKRDDAITEEACLNMEESAGSLGEISQKSRMICPGCVISYVDEEHGALADAMSVVRLDEPIRLINGEEPIRYAIGLSYLESDHLSDMLHAIVFLLRGGALVNAFDMLDDSADAHRYISGIL